MTDIQRNTIKLNLSYEFLESTQNSDYERAYDPLHALACEGDEISLDESGLSVTVQTDASVDDWLDRQNTGLFPDGSGFYQRYWVEEEFDL